MKKILQLVATIMCSTVVAMADVSLGDTTDQVSASMLAEVSCSKDSIVLVNKDGTVLEKTLYTHDAKGRFTSFEVIYNKDGKWLRDYKETCEYDDVENSVIKKSYSVRNDEWKLQSELKYTEEYNEQGQITVLNTYGRRDGEWIVFYRREILSVNEQGHATEILTSSFSENTDMPFTFARTIVQYGMHGREFVVTYVRTEEQPDVWFEMERMTQSYDEKGNLVEGIDYRLQNGVMTQTARATMGYDETGFCIWENQYEWNSSKSTWTATIRDEWTQNDNTVSDKQYSWNKLQSKWDLRTMSETLSSESGNVLSEKWYTVKPGSGEFVQEGTYFYYYSCEDAAKNPWVGNPLGIDAIDDMPAIMHKRLIDGQLIIERDGMRYNVMGTRL